MSENGFFRQFIDEMNDLIRASEKVDGRDQKQMLEDLFQLEDDFKKLLLSNPAGEKTYVKFMEFINEEKGNMLSARVYFRERQDTFSDKMFTAFHKENPKMLHKFKINFMFAKWCLEFKEKEVKQKNGKVRKVRNYQNYKGPHKKRLTDLFNKIVELRSTLCQNNLPLAIHRAKLFWSKVPESHLQYMDMIQAANEGLLTALDKFVPPYRSVFRSTAIGRMSLNLMTDYNDTIVKIPPKEKRILYRANNAKQKANLTDESKIVDYVNESFSGVSAANLSEIEAAASQMVNIYDKQDGKHAVIDKLASPTLDASQAMERDEFNENMRQGWDSLEVIEAKVVRLKTGDV